MEWRSSVPFFGLSLGPYGKAPARATLAPFATVIYSANEAPFAADRGGWYPAVGVGALLFFDLLRIDVARGLHHGAMDVLARRDARFWADPVMRSTVDSKRSSDRLAVRSRRARASARGGRSRVADVRRLQRRPFP